MAKTIPLRCALGVVARSVAVLSLAAVAIAASPARAQTTSLKGAYWLRLDQNYAVYPNTDPRRVAWNLEYAQDIPGLSGQTNSLLTLNTSYGIRTLVRIGDYARPSSAETSALQATSFNCTQIKSLLLNLDAEANWANGGLGAVAAFILGNEPNLPNEWNLVDGRAYGRVYRCYLSHWNAGKKANLPLLFAGPGGCHSGTCQAWYGAALTEIGATAVDGFAIHAYGQNSAAFDTDFRWQVNRINQSKPGAPVYITEYNPGAVYGGPLPSQPNSIYFDECYGKVAGYNAGHGNQIKALMYFVDSPTPWIRSGQDCNPFVPTPPTTGWWQSSLCYNGTRYLDWFNSRPPSNVDGGSIGAAAAIPAFVMPGQISRVSIRATNTGGSTWSGSGVSNMWRLGATTGNGFTFSAFPICGGYFVDNLNARVYACATVPPGTNHTYTVHVRAPTNGATNATLSVQLVHDGVTWFGNNARWAIGVGTNYCGTALTQCILHHRTDLLPHYSGWGWNTACWNRDAIVNDWCRYLDAPACDALKTGVCAAFNNGCRCSAGIHRDGTPIDPNGTFCGYRVCGTSSVAWECGAANVWTGLGTTCY